MQPTAGAADFRSSLFGKMRKVLVGYLVIIAGDEDQNNWTRGRILQVYPWKDRKVRLVDVQTTIGVQQRPVSDLAIRRWRSRYSHQQPSLFFFVYVT